MSLPQIHLNGPPRVTLPLGGTLQLAAREAALLARLHLDGPTSRAAMAGFLWPQADEVRSRANLRQTLLRLKRAIGPVLVEADGVLALAEGVAIAAGTQGRLLGPLEFDDAPALAEWLAERRSRVQRDRLREGLQAAQQHLAAGRFTEALARADAVLADDAAVEEAHRLRMQVFFARGDRAAAITAWDDCRDALRRTYGIQPGSATNELGRRIMAAEAHTPPAAAAGEGAQSPQMGRALVGRDAVLAQARAALAQGHAVVLSGAGGLGKSTLLQALVATGGPALELGARPGDEQLPGVLIARLVGAVLQGPGLTLDGGLRRDLEHLLPAAEGSEAPRPHASARDHRRALAALTGSLQHLLADGVRLLVVDDLQWADALSLEALTRAVGDWLAQPESPLPQPVLAYRSGEAPPAVQRLVDVLQRSRRCVRLELTPLQPLDIDRLLQSALPEQLCPHAATRLALAQALHARVGGNPAFVLDALRALLRLGGDEGALSLAWKPGQPLPLPANLVDSVRARLTALPPSSLQLAQLAAVAGTDFSLGLAAAACGRAPLALAGDFAQLEEAQVLAGTGFVHDLVAEAVSASLPESLRGPLHALVADHLEARGAAPARLAQHRLAAGDRRAAAAAFHRAAQESRRRWLMADAAAAFEGEARTLDAERDRPRRLLALRDAARCWLNQGQPEHAERALNTATALARDERERLQVKAALATLQLNTGRHGELADTARWLSQALPEHEAALDDEELAHALLGVASAAPYVANPEALLATIDSLPPRDGASPRLAARIELAAGMVLNWMGWPARARLRLAQGDALAREHGLDGERVNLGNQLARCDEGLGAIDAASRRCLQTARIARELGIGSHFEADLANLRGLYEARLGRVDGARGAFAEAARLLGPEGRASGYMRLREAMGRLWLGDSQAARTAAEAVARDLDRQAPGPFVAFTCWAMARIESQAGLDPRPWLDRAARSCLAPEGLLALRHRVMRLACGEPPDAGAQSLASELAARELWGLESVVARWRDTQPGHEPPCADPWCD